MVEKVTLDSIQEDRGALLELDPVEDISKHTTGGWENAPSVEGRVITTTAVRLLELTPDIPELEDLDKDDIDMDCAPEEFEDDAPGLKDCIAELNKVNLQDHKADVKAAAIANEKLKDRNWKLGQKLRFGTGFGVSYMDGATKIERGMVSAIHKMKLGDIPAAKAQKAKRKGKANQLLAATSVVITSLFLY